MREIKFRAYLKQEKEMREVFSFCDKFIKVIVGIGTAWKLDRNEFEPIMQFTGLKDKNGVDIYEGDIFADVLNTKDLGIVKFGEYNHCFDKQQLIDFGNHIGFYVEFSYKGTRKDLKYWAKNSEVIGNIYETPELLNSK